MKALLSTSDRTGLLSLGRALVEAGFELVSTGGTGGALAEAGLPVTQVSEITGFPEIMDGRVKTLHPSVHAGILARRGNEGDAAQLARHMIDTIDVVVVNLYPFVETVSRAGATLDEALENIDIGGPAMIRAAAKNFPGVLVVVDPADYGWVAERLPGAPSSVSLEERQRLAQKAFQHVAAYDTAISRYLAGGGSTFGDQVTLGYEKLTDLRYGENPHQAGALYADPLSTGGVARAERLHGMELSFTNILDADAAWRIACDFEEPMATVIKHTNPCGLAIHEDQPTAYRRAFEGDSTSAYGGHPGVQPHRDGIDSGGDAGSAVQHHRSPRLRARSAADAEETQAAQGAEGRARAWTGGRPGRPEGRRRGADAVGGHLRRGPRLVEDGDGQGADRVRAQRPRARLEGVPAHQVEHHRTCQGRRHGRDGRGTAQPGHQRPSRPASRGDKARGSSLASDAFMPFADNVEMAAEGGVTAIVQPGGSLRDDEVIEAANRLGMAMVFTGTRHFLH